jgi:CRP-like cAMP-binding protein
VECLLNESYKSRHKLVAHGYNAVGGTTAPAVVTPSSPSSAPKTIVSLAVGEAGKEDAAKPADVVHLLVLTLSLLAEKIGQHWLLDRKRTLFTGNYLLLSMFLETVPFFQGLSHQEMDTLCSLGVVVHRPANYVVVSEGLPGDAFFVLLHGQVDVSVKGATMLRQKPGKHFGETSLIKDIPCTATIRTVTPCLVLCYHKAAFLELVDSFPGVRDGLEAFIEHCTVVNLKALNLPLFQKVSDERMDVLARNAVFRVLAPGETLFPKGGLDDNGFVVSQVP